MITRKQILFVLDVTVSALSDIREILALVPDYKTLLHHVSMFKVFLIEQYKDQN